MTTGSIDVGHRNKAADAHAIGAVTGLTTRLRRGLHVPPSFVLLGDSITAQNVGSQGFQALGYFTWARIALGNVPLLANSGVSGERFDQMYARIQTAVLDYSPGWCIVQGGTNDIGQGRTAEQIQGSLTSIYGTLLDAGIRVVACTITPTTAADTADEKAALYAVNRWIRNYAMSNPGVVLCDWFNALADPATGSPATGMTSDGTHPSALGASRMGRVLHTALSPYISFCTDLLPMSNAETDNLMLNGMMAGESSGLATSWSKYVDTAGGWTVTTSKVARTHPQQGEWQQVVSSLSGASTTTWQVYQAVASGWAIGDTVYAVCEYEMDAGWTLAFSNIMPLVCYVRGHNVAQSTVPFRSSSPVENCDYFPLRGVLRTSNFVIPDATTSLRMYVAGAVNGTVRFGRCAVRKVS